MDCLQSLEKTEFVRKVVDFMKIEKIEKYLEEVSEGTDFFFYSRGRGK